MFIFLALDSSEGLSFEAVLPKRNNFLADLSPEKNLIQSCARIFFAKS